MLEEQRETLAKRLENGGGLLKTLSNAPGSGGDARLRAGGKAIEISEFEPEEFGPQLDSARQQVDFVSKDYQGKLGDYLNEPENARLLFDPQARRMKQIAPNERSFWCS